MNRAWSSFFRLSLHSAALLGAGCFAASAPAQTAGSLDAGFTLAAVLGDRVNSVAVQPDGNIVIGGPFSQIDGVPRNTIARVHADGTLDAGFVPAVIESYSTRTDSSITHIDPSYVPVVFTTVVQTDGKVLVGGSFFFVNGQPGFGGLIRLNADGSVDGSFAALRFNGTVFSVVPLASGDLLVGGDFSYVAKTRRNCLVELDATGRLKTSFNPGAFAGTLSSTDAVSMFSAVHTIGVQSDGKIVIGGIFTKIGGSALRAIARLNADGSVDASFAPDAAFNPVSSHGADYSVDQVLSLLVQADGKTVVGGDFRDPASGNPINSVYRLKGDGSLDPSFNPGGAGTFFVPPIPASGTAEVGTVNAVAEEPGGKILLGGDFLHYNGVGQNFLVRLNTDGTLDSGFDVGVGPVGSVFGLAAQPDGAVLASGDFQSADGVSRPLVARFNSVAGVPPAVVVRIAASKKQAAGDVKGKFTVTRTGSNQTADLTVSYTVSGTARPGVDYTSLSGEVVIPGGGSFARIPVTPILADTAHANKKVTLTLGSTAAYGLTAHPSASVIIVEPSTLQPPQPPLQPPG